LLNIEDTATAQKLELLTPMDAYSELTEPDFFSEVNFLLSNTEPTPVEDQSYEPTDDVLVL
jgi:hypothetical protein